MIHAIDTETDGLKHSHGNRAFAIAYTDEKEEPNVVYIGRDDIVPIDCMAMVRDKEWVGFNIGFDIPFLNDLSLVPVGTLHDAMIAAHVYNNLEPNIDIATLASKYCKIPNTEDKALDEWFATHGYNKDNKKYNEVPFEIMTPYAKADVQRTLALYKFYDSKGVFADPAYKMEMAVLPVVAKIGERGMRVDVEYAKVEFDRSITILANLERDAKINYGVENIGSGAQLADALFTRGGLKCVTFTEKNNICLDESAIQQYDHPLVDIVLQHRQLAKLANTYLTAIIEKSHQGRLHSSLRQVGARTGRFSSADPNLQNIPRNDEKAPINLRRAFICSEDCNLLFVDLSQIELRILAHYSKEPEMIRILSDRKGDIHKGTAIDMFEEVDDVLRDIAKTINFGVIYGAGGEALQAQINKALRGRKVITLAQAKEFKARFFKARPFVQQFTWDVQNRIAERGFVQGKSGRKYHCEKNASYRATNYLIQGESAMLMKKMMVDVENFVQCNARPYIPGSRLINVIHDEFIFDLHHQDLGLIPGILQTIEQPEGWRVPIFANASISSTNWAEKKKVI